MGLNPFFVTASNPSVGQTEKPLKSWVKSQNFAGEIPDSLAIKIPMFAVEIGEIPIVTGEIGEIPIFTGEIGEIPIFAGEIGEIPIFAGEIPIFVGA